MDSKDAVEQLQHQTDGLSVQEPKPVEQPTEPSVLNILLIDCYDSYTWNVYRLLKTSDPSRDVNVYTIYADQFDQEWFRDNIESFHAIVISPGPGSPKEYAGTLDLVWKNEPSVPTLGICLGFQSLCCFFEAEIAQLDLPCHGQTAQIQHNGDDLFEGIDEMTAMRYHSLYAKDIKGDCTVTATCRESNVELAMAVKHNSKPLRGVLFHPESICSTQGEKLVSNFYRMANDYNTHRLIKPVAESLELKDIRPRPLNSERQDKTISAVRTEAIELSGSEHIEKIMSTLCVGHMDYVLLDSPVAKERWTIFGSYGGPKSAIFSFLQARNSIKIERPSQKAEYYKGDFWAYLAKFMDQREIYVGVNNVPFWGGLLGCIGYSVGAASMGTYSPGSPDEPQSLLLFADRSVVIDNIDKVVYIQSLNQHDQAWIANTKRSLLEALEKPVVEDSRRPSNDRATVHYPDKAAYLDSFDKAQEHLRRGNSYEICLTTMTRVSLPSFADQNPFHLFCRLRRSNPAPFSSFVNLRGTKLLGSSPERFMSYQDGRCVFQPMKGTLRKDKFDRGEAERQLYNPKDLAELRIICDLLRNDLHQIADPVESVIVPKVVTMEEFENVYQLISRIEGTIKEPFTGWDALAHSLPPGSMTGAPKKKTLEIIDSLEQAPRGLYSGVTGYWAVNGDHDWSVVIRSAFQRSSYLKDQWLIGAGGAITVLSEAETEYDEMITKLDSVLPSFLYDHVQAESFKDIKPYQLLETTLLDPTVEQPIFALGRHLERMRLASADLGFVWPGEKYIEAQLANYCKDVQEKSKLRWTLDSLGHLEYSCTPLEPMAEQTEVYVDAHASATDTEFARWKTTSRALYTEARARESIEASEDVLLSNKDGMVTECSIANIAFFRNGAWITPRSEHGLLNGVMRQVLIENKSVVEGDIPVDSVSDGEYVMLFNSVRKVYSGIIRTSKIRTTDTAQQLPSESDQQHQPEVQPYQELPTEVDKTCSDPPKAEPSEIRHDSIAPAQSTVPNDTPDTNSD